MSVIAGRYRWRAANGANGRCLSLRVVLCVFLLFASGRAFAMGTESFGNKPVTAQPQWPSGVVAAINLKSRVYSRWVNGNESFYFKGSAKALNQALKRFAALDIEAREVIILPRKGGARTFRGTTVACDWELRVPSGIFLAVAKKDLNASVHPVLPTLVVYLGSPKIRLDKFVIPSGLELIGVEDLIERYMAGLNSKDTHTAGAAAHLLGQHVAAVVSIDPLIASLDHESDYVRVSAAGALGRFGARARKALPGLRRCEANIREGYKGSVRGAIDSIEGAEEMKTADYRQRIKEIRSFLERHRKTEPTTDKRTTRDEPSPKNRPR